MHKIENYIIAAAGLGKRLRPISEYVPKEMFPINKKPAIDFLINEALKNSAKNIFIVISKEKEIIKKYVLKEFAKNKNIKFIYQENPNGLLDVINLIDHNENNFCLMLGDEVIHTKTKSDYISAFNKTGHSVLMVEKSSNKELYGMVSLKNNTITSYKEKPKKDVKENYAIIGRYIFNIFEFKQALKSLKIQKSDFTELIKTMIKQKQLKGYINKYPRFDISTIDGLIAANLFYKNNS